MVNATFDIETGYGKSTLWRNSNNPGGVKCGIEYCVYQSKEQGMARLETTLKTYVDRYGYDLKAIRQRYCGLHCGERDLIVFTELYNKHLKNTLVTQ